MSKEFPVQQVLELACAAQRLNNGYIKEMTPVYASDGALVFWTQPNKTHILFTLGVISWSSEADPAMRPTLLKVTDEDTALANEIRQHFRKLAFAAMQGENDFQTKVNSLLFTENMPQNEIGYVACLPSVYKRDYAQTQVKKKARAVDAEYLGEIGANILDKDCEILESSRSKNFDAWNITAIIDNKMVSWLSKVDLKLGACVVIKAKVKDHSKHWKHENPVTRLNYVKAAQ
jgi:hypothetical protein